LQHTAVLISGAVPLSFLLLLLLPLPGFSAVSASSHLSSNVWYCSSLMKKLL
jgi:hypothetical protein